MEKISGKYTIKQIFQEHWGRYLNTHPEAPDHVVETIEKMLACRNPERLGYATYRCPDHPDCYTIVPHSCKSRFCNACGKVATDNWLDKACSDFPNVSYNHITFTIPSELRELFLDKPDLSKLLFSVSSQVVLAWCQERGWLPAITSVLHTFGRDLKFHPHIHMLISAGGLDMETKSRWIEYPYMPGGMLEKRFKTVLLYRLYGGRFISHRLKRNLFRMRWYLYVAKQLLIALVTTNYIGRYTKRPPLAEARIVGYDGENVKFYFEDWYQSKLPSYLTVSVESFIGLLIQHIPPKHFRLIRHYGLLHNPTKQKYSLLLQFLFGQIKSFNHRMTWRDRQKSYRKTDPLRCPQCKKEMVLTEIAFWSKKYQCLWTKAIIQN